jgi:hypothetical protein
MLSSPFELPRPRLQAPDLERPSLQRARELFDAGDIVGADLVLRACGRVRPNDAAAGALGVRIAVARNDNVRVERASAEELRRTPRDRTLRLLRVRALFQLGRLDEALEAARAIRAANSGRAGRSVARAVPGEAEIELDARRYEMQALIRARRLGDARALLRQWDSVPPLRFFQALHRGEIELLEGSLDAACATLGPLVADARLPAMIRWHAAFHLARAEERRGDPIAAFAAAAAGNALPHPPFEAEAFDRRIDQLLSSQRGAFFTEGTRASTQASSLHESPVFIVGLPRSGTSLLEQIIASHPEACGIGEQQQADAIAENLERLATLRCGRPTAEDLDREAAAYFEMQGACGATRRRVVNKALGLEYRLGWLARALPRMRVIRIDRDPRDCLLSIHQHPLAVKRFPWACALDTLVHAHRGFTRLMDHWQRELPASCPEVGFLRVRYEDLVERQAETTERILRFLDLEPHPACLRFHESERRVLTPSQDQVREPMNRAGIGRWRRYASLIAPLLDALPTENGRGGGDSESPH